MIMAKRVIVLGAALLTVFCAAPAHAASSDLEVLSQNYRVSTYEFYEALIVDGTSGITFGPTADPIVKFTPSATPPVEIRYHAVWPNQGSDVLLQSEADYLSGRVAATGVVFSPPEWTSVRLTVQLEAAGQITFHPEEDFQAIWEWEYSQQEGPLPLSALWSFTDLTTGQEAAMFTSASDPPAGRLTLDLVASHQYSVAWYLVAGGTGSADLVAFPGEPLTVDTFADLQMRLVVIPAPVAVLLAVIGTGLVGLLRRRGYC
jgi:hypothetical protein